MGVLQPGEEIDVWVVDRALGQGGMGSVYRCHNREAKRILAAVKVLDASLLRLPNAKARFVREAEILFGLDHPGIVKVRNVRMDLALPYLEMEFIDGVNLETRTLAGAMPVAEALPIFAQVADALAYLHARGVRHRDVKPSNLVLQPNGVVKLVDFGIAMEADGATLTERGQTFGSVSYAPPEWLDPERLDPVKWDLYAAGVVFYELLTGRQAFPMTGTGTMQQQVVRMMTAKQRHPPLDPGPAHPPALRALVREMTEPAPEARLADAAVVRARLAAVGLGTVLTRDRSEPTFYTEDAARPVANRTMVPGDEEPLPSPTPAAPTRPRTLPLAAIALAAGALALAGAWRALAVPTTRDVVIDVTGLAPGVPVAVSLGGGAPTTVEGGRLRFDAVPAGTHVLRAAAGAGCTPVADVPGCARTEVGLAVDAARDPLVHVLTLPPPAAAPVAATVAAPPSGEDEPHAAIALPAPTVADAGAKTAGASAPRARGPGRLVTAGQFMKWLAAHPEWKPENARTSGLADADYLPGWSGLEPPGGRTAAPVVGVSWKAAAAYCKGSGGLADIDAAPLQWEESAEHPWHEYRVDDGRPAWRRYDGAPSLAVPADKAHAGIAFRCAR